MANQPDIAAVVQYQFKIDDEVWEDWKDTVPRSKRLDVRLIELIIADTEGRVDAGDIEVNLSEHRDDVEEEEEIVVDEEEPDGG